MSFEVVCFDCDSTLSRVEGIDELARRNGLFEEVSALTDKAMNGELALNEVYGKRLELIKPDQAAIDWLADLYIAEMVDGVAETVSTLLANGVGVHIISGGLRQAILPLAARLGIPDENVHAVELLLSETGQYVDYVRHSPLAVNGGKARICRRLKMQFRALAMVGDGKTDLEAKEAGAFMIGFGGVVSRPLVQEQADVFVTDRSLTAVLPHVL
ncbi:MULTISPECIES: HAD-IB family phosphatase [Methylomonas]|uniref:HAD-IB family phosphatase n=1 Tax=Methylomonas TaxID=416 RepID=UPI001232A17F|nr:HAD-IB family phosphatase [Methylomonas rhizoryzae]